MKTENKSKFMNLEVVIVYCNWHVCIAMNKLKEDPHGNFRELFVLKNRFTGQCGSAGLVEYNPDTGSLSECPV